MKNFHSIQINILQKLLYSNGLRYSQIKSSDMDGSRFTFHLDRLIGLEYITKSNLKYVLTPAGKELANTMDIGDESIKSQAKISVLLVCIDRRSKKDRYLLYTRLKSPFYGYQGYPTGKVKWGEDIISAAKRELFEETGLKGSPKLFAIRHYKILDSKKKLLEDKIFFAYKIINPTGKLVGNSEGEYRWVNKDEIWDYLQKPVDEIQEITEAIDNKSITFLEKEYITDGF